MEHVQEGYYHALGLKFDATPEAIKKSFRKLSLKLHPDRNRDDDGTAKEKFQLVQAAYACLSDEEKRAQYDAIFRMRCVLDQGVALTVDLLRRTDLDTIYYFAVYLVKSLGLREDSVLQINLQEGVAGGRLERWRGGEAVDVRPLSTLRSVEEDSHHNRRGGTPSASGA